MKSIKKIALLFLFVTPLFFGDAKEVEAQYWSEGVLGGHSVVIYPRGGGTLKSQYAPGEAILLEVYITAVNATKHKVVLIIGDSTSVLIDGLILASGQSRTIPVTAYAPSTSGYYTMLMNTYAGNGGSCGNYVSICMYRWATAPSLAGLKINVVAPSVPTVTSPTYSSLTSTSATLGATVSSLGNPASISSRGICMGASPNPTTNCVAATGLTTGAFTVPFTGLSPATTYYYRGYATNTTGTGYSVDGTVTTPGSGTVNVSSNISASWSISGASAISGTGLSQSSTSKPTGTYTITWGDVVGYIKPASQTFTLANGGTITFDGVYTPAIPPTVNIQFTFLDRIKPYIKLFL